MPAALLVRRTGGSGLEAALSDAMAASVAVVRGLASEERAGRIVLPMPPNLSNRPVHWRCKDRLRARYCEHCDGLKAQGLIARPPPSPPWLVRVRVVAYLGNHMDHDNAMARMKWPLDWLVRSGYLTDDRTENLEWVGMPEQRIERSRQRLEFWLETVEAERSEKR